MSGPAPPPLNTAFTAMQRQPSTGPLSPTGDQQPALDPPQRPDSVSSAHAAAPEAALPPDPGSPADAIRHDTAVAAAGPPSVKESADSASPDLSDGTRTSFASYQKRAWVSFRKESKDSDRCGRVRGPLQSGGVGLLRRPLSWGLAGQCDAGRAVQSWVGRPNLLMVLKTRRRCCGSDFWCSSQWERAQGHKSLVYVQHRWLHSHGIAMLGSMRRVVPPFRSFAKSNGSWHLASSVGSVAQDGEGLRACVPKQCPISHHF